MGQSSAEEPGQHLTHCQTKCPGFRSWRMSSLYWILTSEIIVSGNCRGEDMTAISIKPLPEDANPAWSHLYQALPMSSHIYIKTRLFQVPPTLTHLHQAHITHALPTFNLNYWGHHHIMPHLQQQPQTLLPESYVCPRVIVILFCVHNQNGWEAELIAPIETFDP